MPFSPQTRQAIQNIVLKPLIELRDSSPSAGDFSLRFAESILLTIGDSDVLDDPQRQTVQELCEVVRSRPFPGLPWALFISRNLDNVGVVRERLEVFLEDRRHSPHHIAKMAAKNLGRMGITPGAGVLVEGYSTALATLFSALPDRTKRTLRLIAPRQIRRGISEGELLRTQLREHDPGLRVEVVNDGDVSGMLGRGQVDTLITSPKAIGLFKGRVCAIKEYSHEDLPVAAHNANVPTLLICHRYKVWPRDLFTEYASGVIGDTRRFDTVLPEEMITWIATETDVWSPSAFRRVYRAPLSSKLDEYPGWVSDLDEYPEDAAESTTGDLIGIGLVNGRIRMLSLTPDGRYSFVDQADNVHSILDTALSERLALEMAVAELEDLMNSPRAVEEDFQRFFVRYPEFLIGDEYRRAHSKVVLTDEHENALIPDFILEPWDQDGLCDLLELKLPTAPIYVLKKNRAYFAAAVREACAQLRQYSRFFDEERNRNAIRDKYGLNLFRPRMIVIIGRRGNVPPLAVREMELDVPNLQIRTYDDLIRRTRRRLEAMSQRSVM